MSRKKARAIDSDNVFTCIFLALLFLSALAGVIGSFAHVGGAP
jgi:hypothetical protein